MAVVLVGALLIAEAAPGGPGEPTLEVVKTFYHYLTGKGGGGATESVGPAGAATLLPVAQCFVRRRDVIVGEPEHQECHAP